MIAILNDLYSAGAGIRLTVDADAGIDPHVAASGRVQNGLADRGYAFSGGSYRRRAQSGAELLIDLVVPRTGRETDVIIGDYGFVASGGLGLALALPPIRTEVAARLYSGEELTFVVAVPDVEPAFVLKIHAWCQRLLDSDLADLGSLLEIVHRRPHWLASPWRLDTADGVSRGERLDASRLVYNHLLAIRQVPERIRVLAAQYVRDGR